MKRLVLALGSIASLLIALTATAQEKLNPDTHLATPYGLETAQDRIAKLALMDQEFAKPHVGLEFMVAKGSDKSNESRFGHTFLRFLDFDNDPFNDTVVGFYANAPVGIEPGLLDFLGFGTDRVLVPTVEVLNQTILKYQTRDQRDLIRFIIPVLPGQIEKIKVTLRATIIAPDLIGPYNLLHNNCFTAIKKVLSEAGLAFFPSFIGDDMFFIEDYMQKSMMTSYPSDDSMLVKGIGGIMQPILARLAKISLTRRQNEPADENLTLQQTLLNMPEFKAELSKLDDYSIGKLTHFWPFEWRAQRPALIKEYKARELQDRSFKDFTELTEFDPALYTACLSADMNCQERRWSAARKYWSEEDLVAYYRHSMSSYAERMRDEQLIVSAANKIHTEYLTSANAEYFRNFIPESLRKLN